jgi:hypothetical protein
VLLFGPVAELAAETRLKRGAAFKWGDQYREQFASEAQ